MNYFSRKKDDIFLIFEKASNEITKQVTKYFKDNQIDLNAEIEFIGKSCNLHGVYLLQSSGTNIESNYRAAALIILATYPSDVIPWILRNFPRPHGGFTWRAIADINCPPKDTVVNILLDRNVIEKYKGLNLFLDKAEGFLARSEELKSRAAKAWCALLLTQENIEEVEKLYKNVIKSCSIKNQIETEMLKREPEISKYLNSL